MDQTADENKPARPLRVLLVGSTAAEAERLQRELSRGTPEAATVVAPPGVEPSIAQAAEYPHDLIIVDLDPLSAAAIATIEGLRAVAPNAPLIAVTRGGGESLAIEALQAGAQDCLGATEIDGPALLRHVRYAIERNRFLMRREEADERDSRNREWGGLVAIGGPVPLPITERSLGAVPLQQRAPQEFGELTRRYGDLLDRSLLGRTSKETHVLVEDLNDIADRLGILGAGPRDAVDLHKAAISSRLQGQSARKNKAYVEEGRLLLVQLMGHLVSFYRSLSWGRGPSLTVRNIARQDLLATPTASGKKL